MSIRRKLHSVFSRRQIALSGYIDGLILSNDTDTDHDISMSAGEAGMVDSSAGGTTILGSNASALVKRIDANWSAGTGNGGFPSGLSLSNDTWYHYFAIAQSDGTMDAGWDTALTASNLRSDATGYVHYRRIGSVLTDGSSNIIAFVQKGDSFTWDTDIQDLNVNPASDTSEHSVTLSSPIDVVTQVRLRLHVVTTVLGWYVYDQDITEGRNLDDDAEIQVNTDTSSQVKYKSTASGAGNSLLIYTEGWIDPRGRTWT